MWAVSLLFFFPVAVFNLLTSGYIPEVYPWRYSIRSGRFSYWKLLWDVQNRAGNAPWVLVLTASDPPTAAGNKWETMKSQRGKLAFHPEILAGYFFWSNNFYSGRLKTPCRGWRLYFHLEIFRFSCIINYLLECFGSALTFRNKHLVTFIFIINHRFDVQVCILTYAGVPLTDEMQNMGIC